MAADEEWTLDRIEGNETDTQMVALITAGGQELEIRIVVEGDHPHLIKELSAGPTKPPTLEDPPTSWAELQEDLEALAPRVSFLAAEVKDGSCQPVFGINEDLTLAIGSAFKLCVLGELARQVDEGLASWEESLPVRDDIRSFGSPGESTDDAPAGTVFTLSPNPRKDGLGDSP